MVGRRITLISETSYNILTAGCLNTLKKKKNLLEIKAKRLTVLFVGSEF